jgi:hypothetical protein
MTINRSDVRAALARGYCVKANKAKPIDIDLLEAMVDEVMAVISTETQRQDYYRKVRVSDEDSA